MREETVTQAVIAQQHACTTQEDYRRTWATGITDRPVKSFVIQLRSSELWFVCICHLAAVLAVYRLASIHGCACSIQTGPAAAISGITPVQHWWSGRAYRVQLITFCHTNGARACVAVCTLQSQRAALQRDIRLICSGMIISSLWLWLIWWLDGRQVNVCNPTIQCKEVVASQSELSFTKESLLTDCQ